MEEEIKTKGAQEGAEEKQEDSNQMYIDTIKDLKKNTVSNQEYQRVLNENRNLLKTLVEQGQVDATAEPEKPKATLEEINKMRKDLFNNDHSNLDYVSKTLELRKALIENGEPDPFLPQGKNYIATDEDLAAAEKLATVFEECIEYAEGDSELFTNELMRRTVDIPVVKGKKK